MHYYSITYNLLHLLYYLNKNVAKDAVVFILNMQLHINDINSKLLFNSNETESHEKITLSLDLK